MSGTNPFGSDEKLLSFVVSAIRGHAELSLSEVFGLLQLPESLSALAKVEQVVKFTEQCDLSMVPALDKGDLATVRRFHLRTEIRASSEQMHLEVRDGEGPGLEFKSSLCYDHQKAKSYPAAPSAELRSESVLHSFLKTIAAFLNSGGGVLYAGIDDTGSVVGTAEDLLFLKKEKRTVDSWELMLRDAIKVNFKDGENVNDYVRVEFIDCDGKQVARVEVYPRKRLSFLKRKETYALYRRQGNRTAEVTIDQVEEFLALRTG